MYQSLTSPPMEWFTMSTWDAPVRDRTCWTYDASPAALVLLDWAQLYWYANSSPLL
jgi:hypothetical protein